MTERAMQRYRLLRGLLALWVVLGHCSMYLDTESRILELIHELNLLCVGVFFFQSGYGLSIAFREKTDYLKGFLIRKPLRLAVIALISSIVNSVTIFLLGRGFDDLAELLTCLREFINWYVWVQLLFYLFFYLAAKTIRREGVRLIVLTLLVLAATEVLRHTDLGYAYYTAGLAFPAGLSVAFFRERIDRLSGKGRILSTVGLVLTCILCFFMAKQPSRTLINIYGKNLMCASSAILGMFVLMWIPLKGKLLKYLSEISLEIYLYQFVAINAVSRFLGNHDIPKDRKFVILTLISTLLLAVLFSSVRRLAERPAQGAAAKTFR